MEFSMVIDNSQWQKENQSMEELIARRAFPSSYISLDTAFLILLLGLLIWKRKYMTAIVGLVMGAVYMAVDYGIFHLLLGTRSIEGGNLFLTLLWMSMSYGFTNFIWIWLWLEKDRNLFEWSLLILLWWFVCPIISSFLGGHMIVIERTTGAYHAYMAIILIVGYIALIIWNLKEMKARVNIPWLLAIGILVQAGWEIGLLLGGIRSAGLSMGDSLKTMVVNSLLETNLGMPYVYAIFIALTARYSEALKKRKTPLSFRERIKENNGESVRV